MEPDLYGRTTIPEEPQSSNLSLPRAQTWKIVFLTILLLILLVVFAGLFAISRGYNVKRYIPSWVENNTYVQMMRPSTTPSPTPESSPISEVDSMQSIEADMQATGDDDFSQDFAELDSLFQSY